MGIIIKTKREIELMKEGGRILGEIVRGMASVVKPGIATIEIENKAKALLKEYKVKSAFLGYHDYPAVSCIGVNDNAVHGIPSETEILKEGDILSLDMGLIYEGLYLDHAISVGVGEISKENQKLLDVTRDAMMAGVNQVKVGGRIGDISNAIQTVVESAGFSVITQMVGHGVGHEMHEEPQIPCFGEKGTGEVIEEGMTLAIEAMVNAGGSEIVILDDGWTTKTADGSNSCMFEHSIAVTGKKAEILTK